MILLYIALRNGNFKRFPNKNRSLQKFCDTLVDKIKEAFVIESCRMTGMYFEALYCVVLNIDRT